MSSDTILMPLAADLFSLRGLRNLGPALREWQRDWQEVVAPRIPEQIEAHAGDVRPLGYVTMQPIVRVDRPLVSYQRWLERIPLVYDRCVLGNDPPSAAADNEIATIRNYRSLMPLAHDARKPMFDLRPADGAMGSTLSYVQTCRSEFEELTRKIDARLAAVATE
nr:hypothetical protein [Nocardiopsis mwathae]